jgi:hypothetical protein
MRPCARHEIILLSVEVIQAARPGVWRGGEAQSREIIEKLDRIGQLLVNGAWLPVSKMHIKEKRYATNKDHFSGSGYHFMANAHDLPHRTSSRELAASAMWYARKSGRPFRSSHVDDVSRTLNGNLVTVGW